MRCTKYSAPITSTITNHTSHSCHIPFLAGPLDMTYAEGRSATAANIQLLLRVSRCAIVPASTSQRYVNRLTAGAKAVDTNEKTVRTAVETEADKANHCPKG